MLNSVNPMGILTHIDMHIAIIKRNIINNAIFLYHEKLFTSFVKEAFGV